MADPKDVVDKIAAAIEPSGLHHKIRKASEHIGVLEASGHNAFFKFFFQSWIDALPALRGAVSTFDIWVVATIVDSRIFQSNNIQTDKAGNVTGNKSSTYYEVTMEFKVVDMHTGETEVSTWKGLADLSDDKAAQKAGTQAYKYAALKLFMIPAKDDTDSDGHAPQVQQPEQAKPMAIDTFIALAGEPEEGDLETLNKLCSDSAGVLDKTARKTFLVNAMKQGVKTWKELIEGIQEDKFS